MWCSHCREGRGQEFGHSAVEKDPRRVPLIAFDYAGISDKGEVRKVGSELQFESGDESATRILVIKDDRSQYGFAHLVPCKGVDKDRFTVECIVNDIIWMGYTKVMLNCDNEPAILKLLVEALWDLRVKGELEMTKGQLASVLPQLERTSQASIADLESRASIANAQLTASIDDLEKRDQEMSAKLKSTFEQIDAQMENVQLQGATVASIQEGVHSVVVKQQLDMEKARVDVERYLADAMAAIASKQADQSQGEQRFQPRGGEGPRLNDARKSEVADLTDGMTKAACVLWRENLDLH